MYTFVRIFVKEGGRFLGKRYASNETLPVYGERERGGGKGKCWSTGRRRFRKRIEREREGEDRVGAAVKKKEEGGARAFCNFYNLNSAAAGVARNCSNPEERVSLRVYF